MRPQKWLFVIYELRHGIRIVQFVPTNINHFCRWLQVKPDYGVAVFTVGLVATFVGQTGATALMQRLQRRSVVIGCMAALMVLSTVVMYAEAFVKTRSAILRHELWNGGSICS